MAGDDSVDVARATPAEAAERSVTMGGTGVPWERGMGGESSHIHAAEDKANDPVKEHAEKGPEAKIMRDDEVDHTIVHADETANGKDDHAQSDTVQEVGEGLSEETPEHGAPACQCDAEEELEEHCEGPYLKDPQEEFANEGTERRPDEGLDGSNKDSEECPEEEPEDPEKTKGPDEAPKDDPEMDPEESEEEDSEEDSEEDLEDSQEKFAYFDEDPDEESEDPDEESEDPDEDPDGSKQATPSDDSDEVIVIDDSDEAPCELPPPAPRPTPTDALSRYLASRPSAPRRASRFRPVYTTGALKAPPPEPIRPGRAKGVGPMPRRSLSSLSQRRKAPLAMAEFRAGLQARQQARIAAMVRDTFHTLRGARTRGTWEDFQALVHKRAHVQQLLDLETLRTHPRTPVLDEAEYTKRTLAALQAREAHARARLPERPVPVEAQRQAVRAAKARRRAAHGILGRAVLPSALPAPAEAQVQQAFAQRGVVASMTGAQVEAHDMAKLRPGQWLNDEVINFYGQLIQQRANHAAPQQGDASSCWAVHVFSSFFWQNLSTRGYAGVRRWSRRVDLFTKDLVLMPINLGQAHWVCAAIDLRLRRFAYYDSMGMSSPSVLQRLRAYLADELKDKHGLALSLDDWEDYCAGDTSPQQSNGYDCGVFAAQTLEQLSRRDPAVPYPPPLEAGSFARCADPKALALLREEYAGEYAWNFSQRDMPYLRRRMVYEIATKQLLA